MGKLTATQNGDKTAVNFYFLHRITSLNTCSFLPASVSRLLQSRKGSALLWSKIELREAEQSCGFSW